MPCLTHTHSNLRIKGAPCGWNGAVSATRDDTSRKNHQGDRGNILCEGDWETRRQQADDTWEAFIHVCDGTM